MAIILCQYCREEIVPDIHIKEDQGAYPLSRCIRAGFRFPVKYFICPRCSCTHVMMVDAEYHMVRFGIPLPYKRALDTGNGM